jgi:hypothetical protein
MQDYLTIREIQDELGTSYISAYRWAVATLGNPDFRVGTARLYSRAKSAPAIAAHRRRGK